jgi:hypothetical protein
MSNDERIGEIVHYYHKISVAVIKLNRPLKLGDKVVHQRLPILSD